MKGDAAGKKQLLMGKDKLQKMNLKETKEHTEERRKSRRGQKLQRIIDSCKREKQGVGKQMQYFKRWHLLIIAGKK